MQLVIRSELGGTGGGKGIDEFDAAITTPRALFEK